MQPIAQYLNDCPRCYSVQSIKSAAHNAFAPCVTQCLANIFTDLSLYIGQKMAAKKWMLFALLVARLHEDFWRAEK